MWRYALFAGTIPVKSSQFFESYPMLKGDNELLRENGIDGWLAVQAERRASGFVYNG